MSDAATPNAVAFVAGATGFTGREVVAELVRRGVRTLAHVRPDSSRLDEWRERFEAMGLSLRLRPAPGRQHQLARSSGFSSSSTTLASITRYPTFPYSFCRPLFISSVGLPWSW